MENLDHKILPPDDNGALNNLGKKRRNSFISTDNSPNPEGSSFGMSPDESHSLRDEGKIDAYGVELTEEDLEEAKLENKEGKEEDSEAENSENGNRQTVRPVLMGGEKGMRVSSDQSFGSKKLLGESHVSKPLKPNRKTIRGMGEWKKPENGEKPV